MEAVERLGWNVMFTEVVSDDRTEIEAMLIEWCASDAIDVILTTGGTGFAPRDQAPEATRAVLERPASGLAEAMRAASMKITPHAMLSRAEAGIRGRTLIVNLPGSPKAALENLQVVSPALPHAVSLLREDPNAEAGHHPPTLKHA
jgi:molybdenum cofactor synthesis domain-containing protein